MRHIATLALLIGITACDNAPDNDARIAAQLKGIADVQANQQQVLAALARNSTTTAASATAGTVATTTTPPAPCAPGMTCTTYDTTGKVVGVVVGAPTVAPDTSACPTGKCNTQADASAVPPDEACTMGLCLFTTIASYIGAVGVYIAEGIIIAGVLGALAYVLLVRLPQRRRDRTWHQRATYWYGQYRAARRRSDADPGNAELLVKVEEAWARYAGFTERGQYDPATAPTTHALPMPPPATLPSAAT